MYVHSLSCISIWLTYEYITQFVFRQVRNLCQSQFSTECALVLLPISSILSCPEGHPVADYIFFLVFTSLLSFPPVFRSITCFRRQFLHKMWPIQWAILHFTVRTMYRSSLLSVTLLHFSHDRSNCSSPPFSSTTLQNFPQCPVPAPHKAVLQT
jgi:hypothetical protein